MWLLQALPSARERQNQPGLGAQAGSAGEMPLDAAPVSIGMKVGGEDAAGTWGCL